MRNGVACIETVSHVLTPQSLDALRRIVDDRCRPLTHILRARIVLLSDERLSVLRGPSGCVGCPTAWRWQRDASPEGLGRAATRQDATARQARDTAGRMSKIAHGGAYRRNA